MTTKWLVVKNNGRDVFYARAMGQIIGWIQKQVGTSQLVVVENPVDYPAAKAVVTTNWMTAPVYVVYEQESDD